MHKTTYGFDVNGERYRGTSTGYGNQIGTTVDVLYAPAKPKVNMAVDRGLQYVDIDNPAVV